MTLSVVLTVQKDEYTVQTYSRRKMYLCRKIHSSKKVHSGKKKIYNSKGQKVKLTCANK